MESNNELKEIDLKKRICHYFDDIIKIEDFDFCNILINEKAHENIFVSDMSCKTLIGAEHLSIGFNKINQFIRVYDGNRYLILFRHEKCDFIFNSIRYPIDLKSGIIHVISHYYAKT